MVPLSPISPPSRFALSDTPANARDLANHLFGATSGCPPPSHGHNYRCILHTQQRNRLGRPQSGRFWKPVAQIARRLSGSCVVSNCNIITFRESSIFAGVIARAARKRAFHREWDVFGRIVARESGRKIPPALPCIVSPDREDSERRAASSNGANTSRGFERMQETLISQG